MAVIPIPQHIINNGTIDTSDILNLYYLLTGVNTYSVVIGNLSVTGAMNLSGSLTVPSGQTATVAGTLDVTGSETVASSTITTLDVTGSETVASSTITTLDVTGSATVPAATASNQAVQQAQVANSAAALYSGASGAYPVATISLTSPNLTAPSNGFFFVLGTASIVASGTFVDSTSQSLTSSLAGFVSGQNHAGNGFQNLSGYLVVTAGQIANFTETINYSPGGSIAIQMTILFFPTP